MSSRRGQAQLIELDFSHTDGVDSTPAKPAPNQPQPFNCLRVIPDPTSRIHDAGQVGATITFSATLAIFGLGECIHGTIQTALSVDLARLDLMGRYMALSAFSRQLGMAVGPAAGGFLLAASPTALWLSAAGVCGAGSVGALLLERRLPREALRTPAAAAI